MNTVIFRNSLRGELEAFFENTPFEKLIRTSALLDLAAGALKSLEETRSPINCYKAYFGDLKDSRKGSSWVSSDISDSDSMASDRTTESACGMTRRGPALLAWGPVLQITPAFTRVK